MEAYQTIIPTVDAGILTILLNRPDKLNTLNDVLLDELADIFAKAADDDAIKGVLITGEGKAFCAGADIHQLLKLNAQTGFDFSQKGQGVFRLLEQLGKPSIAAINGFAMGGGCEFAISATIRIASKKAMFSQPEVKLGVIPGYGGTQRLARLIGKGRALDLCVTGRSINASQALEFGLVSEVVSSENLLPRAKEILTGILSMAPLAIKNVIAVINDGYDLPLEDALRLEAADFAALCATQDKQIGVTAFLEKRPAEFSGR